MAADLHIHILTAPCTEAHVRKLNDPSFPVDVCWSDVFSLVHDTPNVHVGEVSWTKAAIFEDNKIFIPGPVQAVQNTIPPESFIKIDDALIGRISNALRVPNASIYKVSNEDEVLVFLAQHKGAKAFTISW